MSPRLQTLTYVALAFAAGLLAAYLFFVAQAAYGETPIVIGEGASIKLGSPKAPFTGWIQVDETGKPATDESVIWYYPGTKPVIRSVKLTVGGQTKIRNWPSNGRLIVTYDRTTGGEVALTVIALNSANNGLAIVQQDLKGKNFAESNNGSVRTSRNDENVGKLKKVILEGAANPVLCGSGTPTSCAGGSVEVALK